MGSPRRGLKGQHLLLYHHSRTLHRFLASVHSSRLPQGVSMHVPLNSCTNNFSISAACCATTSVSRPSTCPSPRMRPDELVGEISVDVWNVPKISEHSKVQAIPSDPRVPRRAVYGWWTNQWDRRCVGDLILVPVVALSCKAALRWTMASDAHVPISYLRVQTFWRTRSPLFIGSEMIHAPGLGKWASALAIGWRSRVACSGVISGVAGQEDWGAGGFFLECGTSDGRWTLACLLTSGRGSSTRCSRRSYITSWGETDSIWRGLICRLLEDTLGCDGTACQQAIPKKV